MRHMRSCIEVLSKREIEQIHQASLEVLREVGAKVPNEHLLDRLRSVGAKVNGDRVLLPEHVISRMLKECIEPCRGKRSSRWTINRGQLRVGNAQEMTILTYPHHNRRPGTLEDIVKGIAITNALPMVRRAQSVVVPSDVPLELAPLEGYRLGCLYSRKRFSVNHGARANPYLIEMAEVMVRATARPKREQGFGFGFAAVSPLRFAEEDLACAVRTAGRGWPATCYSFPVIGATGPVSMAGTLVLMNAERLACLTLMWLWGEIGGYQKGHVDDPCMIDPHSLASSFGHPNLSTLVVGNTQVAKLHGLRAPGGLAQSDPLWIDFQAGFERGVGSLFCILTGGSIGTRGIIGADQTLSFEQLIIDNAAVECINWIMQGIEVTQESLAVNVIKEVGIGGNYLDREHTAKYMRREYWGSPLFPRQDWSSWELNGRETLMERAHREVERILAANYPPKQLVSDEVAKRLDEIVEQARADLVGR